MSKHDLNELTDLLSELNNSTQRVTQRIKNLKKYKNSGSVEPNELETLFQAGKSIENDLNKPNNDQRFHQLEIKDSETESIKSKILKNLTELDAINASLNDLEEKFQKYNLPKRDILNSDTYTDRLSRFMATTWRESAERSWRNGKYSLMDCMIDLKLRDMKETLNVTKASMVKIGLDLSNLIIDYLWTISLFEDWSDTSERVLEMENVVKCLSIGESSSLIEGFVAVLKLFHGTMLLEKNEAMAGPNEKGKSVVEDDESSADTEFPWLEKEEELFHLILMEILRFEVSFQSPDLAGILESEMYGFVADHLKEYVFKEKLREIKIKINDLQVESLRGSVMGSFEELLKFKVMIIWSRQAYNCTAI